VVKHNPWWRLGQKMPGHSTLRLFVWGYLDMLPLWLGAIPVGIAYGVAARDAGLSFVETQLMSLAKHSPTEARLRLLLVEPPARGSGLETQLVRDCIRCARQMGYQQLTLWTNNVLLAARRIYAATGFRLIHEAPHHSFGHDLIGETWALTL
jgi:GNAT superfamily N-acetyltransferase